MAKFVLVYTGGKMAETPEEQQASMDAWTGWFGSIGDSVADMGAPFGASTTVSGDGASEGNATGATGYSIVNAADLDEAAGLAKGCPIIADGGTVEVFQAIEM